MAPSAGCVFRALTPRPVSPLCSTHRRPAGGCWPRHQGDPVPPADTASRNAAACLEDHPELLFAIGNSKPALLQIEEARAVCALCEVVGTCLKWAIESRQDTGVWGGLSEDERRALRRRNVRARRARRVLGRPAHCL